MIPHKPVYEFHSVFAPHIREYLSIKEALGEKTTMPGNILRQFDRYCSSIRLDEAKLTPELAENWFLTKFGEKSATRSHRISVLWGFARHFSSSGGEVTWRPTPGYAGRMSRYVPYIFTKNEMMNILTAADSMPKPYGKSRFNAVFPAVIRVLYGCGLRISEALALKVKDVDLDNGFIFVHAGKFGKDRKIPISDSLLKYLREYRSQNEDFIGIDADGWFFPNAKGECYSQRTVYDKFRQILWIAGISHQGKGKGPRVHDLRHTFAVHSLQQNVEKGKDIYTSLTGLMVYLGHGKITSTEYYLRMTAEVFPDFLKRADKVCSGVIPEVVDYED